MCNCGLVNLLFGPVLRMQIRWISNILAFESGSAKAKVCGSGSKGHNINQKLQTKSRDIKAQIWKMLKKWELHYIDCFCYCCYAETSSSAVQKRHSVRKPCRPHLVFYISLDMIKLRCISTRPNQTSSLQYFWFEKTTFLLVNLFLYKEFQRSFIKKDDGRIFDNVNLVMTIW